jgi:hypothetical protein
MIKNDKESFSSSSADSGSEVEEGIKELILPPIEPPKIRKNLYQRVKLPKVEPPSLYQIETQEVPVQKNITQDTKGICDLKRNVHSETLIRSYMTPKKLMEVRNKSSNPYNSSISRDLKPELMVREFFKTPLKSLTAKNKDRNKTDSLQKIINSIAYS